MATKLLLNQNILTIQQLFENTGYKMSEKNIAAGQQKWVYGFEVEEGLCIQVSGTFAGEIVVQRKPCIPGTLVDWVTSETISSPTVITGAEYGIADYRVGTLLVGSITSGTANISVMAKIESLKTITDPARIAQLGL